MAPECLIGKMRSLQFNKNKNPLHLLNLVILQILLLTCFQLSAQQNYYINGKVTEQGSGKPLANCSVYFSNTSKGVVTNASGDFTLKNLPAGKYEMVISAIGYETQVILVSSNDYPLQLKISLRVRVSELAAVTVQPAMKNGWQEWGQYFLEKFIGKMPNAYQCRLKNKEVVKFWFSEKNNRLTVRAEEPLIIENRALGYIIKFDLDEFTSDFNSHLMVYLGYPFFQEMTSENEKVNTRWKENRKDAYYGSVLHFMRMVYKNRYIGEGYNVVSIVKRFNEEKQRVKNILNKGSSTLLPDSLLLQGSNSNNQSTNSKEYYKRILKQPDTLTDYIALMSLDSIITNNPDRSLSLFFMNKMEVLYKRTPKSRQFQSRIYLASPEPIQIEGNGSYHSPKELVITGHWAESEKLGNLLPFDYSPSNNKLAGEWPVTIKIPFSAEASQSMP